MYMPDNGAEIDKSDIAPVYTSPVEAGINVNTKANASYATFAANPLNTAKKSFKLPTFKPEYVEGYSNGYNTQWPISYANAWNKKDISDKTLSFSTVGPDGEPIYCNEPTGCTGPEECTGPAGCTELEPMVDVNPRGPTGLPDDTAAVAMAPEDENGPKLRVADVISGSDLYAADSDSDDEMPTEVRRPGEIEPTYPEDAYRPVNTVEPTL